MFRQMFLSLAFLTGAVWAEPSFKEVASPLRQAANKLSRFPEAQMLMRHVEKEGKVSLEWANLGPNHPNALWDADRRRIILNAAYQPQEGSQLSSILFELHNALTNTQFLHLDHLARHGQIDKEHYVESVERLEHQNALNTRRLLEKGIAQGHLPPTARWDIVPDFDDHYKVQQLVGHSAQIAAAYEMLNPHGHHMNYRGTISAHRLSPSEKQHMLSHIAYKHSR